MKKVFILVWTLSALLVLPSCALKGGNELFSLPRMSSDNLALQSAIDTILADGAVYSAPISGQNQQNIQLVDIDDDGEEEAISFFKTETEKPLRIYIFKKISGIYENTAIIEGVGTAFVAIEYVQLDGVPGLELLVTRQVSDQVQKSITAYKIDGSTVSTVLSAAYLEYKVSDLDSDQCDEVLLFNKDPETGGWYADFFKFAQGVMNLSSTAPLSEGLESIKRMKKGVIEGGVQAVFVSGVYQSTGLVTDILVCKDGALANITISEGSMTSIQTLKNYIIYPIDVNDDGVYEIARPSQLPNYSGESGEIYYSVNWYGITKYGELIKKLSTYHNYSESWFVILPDEWVGNISVSRAESKNGERPLVFYHWLGEDVPPESLMTIYTLTGDNRKELAEQDGRFILYDRSDTIYAASFAPDCEWEYMITSEELISRFKLISSEWVTGETY